MKQDNYTILLGTLFILFLSYLVYSSLFMKRREGLDNSTATATTSSSSSNGIAGNAVSFASTIKQKNINLTDTLLISKYKKDYETLILNVDDLLNSMMLQSVLTIDTSSANTPSKLIENMKMLNELSAAKDSLNKVMKFVDGAS
jgi:hypothetical protein